MKDSDDEIQKLLRLKRYERPEEGYFDEFCLEFQRRQRAEMLQRSARGIFCERVATYFSGFGKEPLLIGAGAAAAIAAVFVYMQPGDLGATAENAAPRAVEASPLWEFSGRPVGERLLPVDFPSERTVFERPVFEERATGGQLIPASNEYPRDF